METYFRSYIEILKMELDRLDFYHIEQILDVILNARKNNQQIFIIGNGGSAATASHIACDLAKGTIDPKEDDFRRFRIISLTDNMALFTAIANDLTYDDVFVEQLKNLLNPNDIVIAITASGNSPNIIKAIRFAKQQGAVTIGVLGFSGGIANKLVDYQLTIASQNYGIAEDFHLIAGHIISQMLQKILKRESYPVVFLDRDGVINQKAAEHDYIKNWEEFRFIPGVFKGLKILQSLNFRLMVISNQRGIARRLFSESDLKDIHDRMLQEFRKDNIEIDKIYYCPHDLKDECSCRKPAL